MRTLAIVLGLAFAVIAIVYLLVPAGSLPSVFPGFEAGSPQPRRSSPSCFSPSRGTRLPGPSRADRSNWQLGDEQSVHVLLSGRRDWLYASAARMCSSRS